MNLQLQCVRTRMLRVEVGWSLASPLGANG